MATPNVTSHSATAQLSMAAPKGRDALRAAKPKSEGNALRQRVGEFVGNVFYGTLMRQMENSKIKGKYFHGGRGEEVFRGQLNMELARRMGQSPGDPIAEKMYQAFKRQDQASEPKPAELKGSETGLPLKTKSTKGIPLEAARSYQLGTSADNRGSTSKVSVNG